MEQLRVGVIGVGRMGQRHCRVYSNMRKVHLVGIYDVNSEVGNRVAEQYEIEFYENLHDLLDKVDAVSLASPTQAHFEQSNQCISAGVHVLIEKPITETMDEAESLVQVAEESGLIVQVGHIERFNPAYIELKNVLEGIAPLAVTFQRLSPFRGSNLDVDVVLDLMIHDTNLVLDLIGKPLMSFSAHGISAYSSTVDHAVAQLCFDSGPLLTMTASRVTENKVRKITVTSHDAFLECDLLNKTLSIHRSTKGEYLSFNKGIKYRQESVVEWINVPPFEPLLLELQNFVDCICNGAKTAVSVRDGFDAMKLAIDIRDQIFIDMLNLDRRKTPRFTQVAIA